MQSLEYAPPLKSPILTRGSSLGYPFRCASDGAVIFPIYSVSDKPPARMEFSLYSGTPNGDSIQTVRYSPAQAVGLTRVMPAGGFAASDSGVVFMVNAVTAEEDAKDKKFPQHPFLLFFNRKGDFLRSAALDVPFTVAGIGLYDSGDVLLIGAALVDGHQHWTVVDDHGRFQRNLSPEDDSAPKKEIDERAKLAAAMSFEGTPQVVPYRGHLVLLRMNTDLPVLELNGGGVVRSVALKVPKGQHLWQMIPSDGLTWKVVLSHTADETSSDGAIRPGSPVPGKIGEFDPETGELLRLIDVGKSHYAMSIACERDGSYVALSTDPGDGSLLFQRATVGR